ncbi:hypothetical protein [Pseudooceanicola sp. LIPI14-2-Ac024]|uniref:hypothetical protein n=1 Tax=Pseudooceanicola sp. LIPI14-2-Ac024 TaxID=3344875 RepID=UPI0035D012AE
MRDDKRPSAPNYTTAFLCMAFVNLLWIFVLIWAHYGIVAVAAVGYALDRLIQRIARRA